MNTSDRTMFHRVIFCLMILLVGVAICAPVLAAEGEPAGPGDMNPLGPSAWKLDLAIWTAVVFVCLLAVLGKFAWKPIADGLDKRERNVADQIAQAEAANQKAKDILADYERKLADAQEQVYAVLEKGRHDAEEVGRQLVDKAKEDAHAEYQRAVKQIDAATAAAIKELADMSATLAVELAGKIVHAKLNQSDHAQLIEQAVAGFVAGKTDVSKVSRN
jgi:F-type H+-transporting ATPase subunit b